MRVPGPIQSNQIGEIVAVLVAAQIVSPAARLHIISDSLYVIEGLTKYLPHWEDKGWIGIANKEFFQATAYQLRKRTAKTTFSWVKGHSANKGNQKADELAGIGATLPTTSVVDLTVPTAFQISGAKVATLTQALAYQGIRESTPPPQRAASTTNLEIVRQAIQTQQVCQ